MNYTIKKSGSHYTVWRNSPAGEPVSQPTLHRFDDVSAATYFVQDHARASIMTAPSISIDLRGEKHDIPYTQEAFWEVSDKDYYPLPQVKDNG